MGDLRGGFRVLGNLPDGGTVLFNAGGILGDPVHEGGFLGAGAVDDVELLEGLLHALEVLAVVAGGGELVGVLQLDGRVGAHGLPHDAFAEDTGGDGHVLLGFHVLELDGGHEALGAAGIAHDHGEVILFHALEADLEVLLRPEGDVLGAVIGRGALLVGVDAEHGEVAGVAGPHPVVRLAAELADSGRRGADQTDVPVLDIGNQVVDVVVVEGDDLLLLVVEILAVLGEDAFLDVLEGDIPLLGGTDLIGHVDEPVEELDRQAGARQFLAALYRPETVAEVVVLRGAELLDAAVAAVVVRDQQAFFGDHFGRAAIVELDDGVLEGGMVDAVDLLGREPAAFGGHDVDVHRFQQRQEPHALVRGGREGQRRGEKEGSKDSFHYV